MSAHEAYDPEFVDAAVLFFVNRNPGDPMAEIARVESALDNLQHLREEIREERRFAGRTSR